MTNFHQLTTLAVEQIGTVRRSVPRASPSIQSESPGFTRPSGDGDDYTWDNYSSVVSVRTSQWTMYGPFVRGLRLARNKADCIRWVCGMAYKLLIIDCRSGKKMQPFCETCESGLKNRLFIPIVQSVQWNMPLESRVRWMNFRWNL